MLSTLLAATAMSATEPMDLTTVVTLTCKILAIGIGTVLGAIGLVKESVDPDTKKVTRWGRFALAGVILSGIVGLISEGIHSYSSARSGKELLNTLSKQVKHQQDTLTSQEVLLREINRGLYPFSADTTIRARFQLPLDQPFVFEYGELLRQHARQAGLKTIPLDPGDPLSFHTVPQGAGLKNALQSVLIHVSFNKNSPVTTSDQAQVSFRIWASWNAGTHVLPRRGAASSAPAARAFYNSEKHRIVLELSNWSPDWLKHEPEFLSLLDFKAAHVAVRIATPGYGIRTDLAYVGVADRTGRCMYVSKLEPVPGEVGQFRGRMPDNDSALWRV